MIISLGGTPYPLIKSISTYCPEKVIFLASHDSVPLSQTILNKVPEKPAIEFEITENPNSMYNCYQKAMDCVARALKSRLNPEYIMVDYTGGTKVMATALILASLGRSFRFNYVGGIQREKDGLGIVMKGHEIMFAEASPWAVFAEEEQRQVVTLFNCRRFSAVVEILDRFDRQVPPRISDFFEFILPLAKGFLLWDQFSHKAAKRNLENGTILLEKFIQIYPSPELELFQEELKECISHLNDVVEQNNGSDKFNPMLVKDLINNARRKMDDERFDDAAARIYRALELYGQIVFKQAAGCNNSKVKLNIIPDYLRDSFKTKYYDPYTKHLKLPLRATYEYLKAMDNKAGIRFFKMEKEIKNIQSSRNNSILAHGINPVSKKGAESILNTVCKFIGQVDFFNFPKLP